MSRSSRYPVRSSRAITNQNIERCNATLQQESSRRTSERRVSSSRTAAAAVNNNNNTTSTSTQHSTHNHHNHHQQHNSHNQSESLTTATATSTTTMQPSSRGYNSHSHSSQQQLQQQQQTHQYGNGGSTNIPTMGHYNFRSSHSAQQPQPQPPPPQTIPPAHQSTRQASVYHLPSRSSLIHSNQRQMNNQANNQASMVYGQTVTHQQHIPPPSQIQSQTAVQQQNTTQRSQSVMAAAAAIQTRHQPRSTINSFRDMLNQPTTQSLTSQCPMQVANIQQTMQMNIATPTAPGNFIQMFSMPRLQELETVNKVCFAKLNSFEMERIIVNPRPLVAYGIPNRVRMSDLIQCHQSRYRLFVRFCKYSSSTSEQTDCMPKSFIMNINNVIVNIKNKHCGMPYDITARILLEKLPEFTIKFQPDPTDAIDGEYYYAIFLVKKVDHSELTRIFLCNKPYDENFSINLVKRKLNPSDEDDDDLLVIEDAKQIKVSLLCPLSALRIKTPARSKFCDHIHCFDAATFIAMNDINPRWRCPVCKLYIKLEDMIIDGLFINILKTAPPECTEVEVFADGTFHHVVTKESKKFFSNTTNNNNNSKRLHSPEPINGGSKQTAKNQKIEVITILDSDDEADDTISSSHNNSTSAQSSTTTQSDSNDDDEDDDDDENENDNENDNDSDEESDSDIEIVFEKIVTTPNPNGSTVVPVTCNQSCQELCCQRRTLFTSTTSTNTTSRTVIDEGLNLKIEKGNSAPATPSEVSAPSSPLFVENTVTITSSEPLPPPPPQQPQLQQSSSYMIPTVNGGGQSLLSSVSNRTYGLQSSQQRGSSLDLNHSLHSQQSQISSSSNVDSLSGRSDISYQRTFMHQRRQNSFEQQQNTSSSASSSSSYNSCQYQGPIYSPNNSNASITHHNSTNPRVTIPNILDRGGRGGGGYPTAANNAPGNSLLANQTAARQQHQRHYQQQQQPQQSNQSTIVQYNPLANSLLIPQYSHTSTGATSSPQTISVDLNPYDFTINRYDPDLDSLEILNRPYA